MTSSRSLPVTTCPHCGTDRPDGLVETTCDMPPHAEVAVWSRRPDGSPDFDAGPVHHCKSGVVQVASR